MIRNIALAAIAATLVAAAASAESIRISTAGKSAEQVKTEIYRAARTVCMAESYDGFFPMDTYRACFDDTVKAAIDQTRGIGPAIPQP
jgi:hypothetical protein